jgi:hypothetical protein
MIRPILTELAIFLTPFALYALFLIFTRAGVLHPESWSWQVLGWLSAVALASVIISFIVIAQFAGAPPNSTYIPAHIENGRFVPGETR